MKIRRRLFISNMLMLVVPVILSVIMITTIGELLFKKQTTSDAMVFRDSTDVVNRLASKWVQNIDIKQIKADVDSFNENHIYRNTTLSIYQGKTLIYPPSAPVIDASILDIELTQQGNILVMDNLAMYRKDVGKYSIISTTISHNLFGTEDRIKLWQLFIKTQIVIIIIIIAIIIATNRFLVRFVFKSIITSLDTLVYGVRQIRDGNLNYHIEYNRKDEFAGVCSDFNEMAQQLLDSVNARQKDEANRRELIAGISHDLRTPLTSIKAYVEGIEKGVAATPETQKRYLDIIKNKTVDLEHVVNQLFLFSKLDIGEFPFYMEQVNIGRELSFMISNLSEEYKEKGLDIILSENVKNVIVKVDIVQLRNAIINVLENSVKYKNKEKGQMKIVCIEEEKFVSISLTDNGPGVSPEAVEKLFDVFFRGDPSRSNPSKGSGLGLAITAKILEGLGGLIRAENVPEGGLSIIMMLPKIGGLKR